MLWWIGMAWGACPDAPREVQQALASLTLLDLQGAHRDLDDAERGLGCGAPATAELLGDLWLAQGVLASLEGDFDSARIAFAAARAVVDEPDLAPFGEVIQNAFDSAKAPEGTARLDFQPSLGDTWQVRVDGVARERRQLEVPAGLHAIQVLDPEGPAHRSWMAVFASGDTVVMEHDLPEVPPPPPRPPLEVRSALQVTVGTQALIGNGYRTAVDGTELIEPVAKLLVPVGFGVHTWIGRGWTRLSGHVAPLVNGQFVYAGPSVPRGTRWAWGLEAGGGARIGAVDVGVLLAARVPSRMQVRAVAGLPLGDTWLVEPHLGLAIPTDRGPEPILGIDLGARFGL